MPNTPLFKRASDEVLRAAGFDPRWILADDIDTDASRGPYRVYRENHAVCPCCGSSDTTAFTVINLATAMGGSQDWYGDNGEVEADETANALNVAWIEGYLTRDQHT